MDKNDQYSELIETIYSAPFRESGWNPVLERLKREFESEWVHLHVADLQAPGMPLSELTPYEPHVVDQYFDYYWSIDPRFETLVRGDNKPRTRQQLVPDEAFKKTEIYNDFLRKNRAEQLIVVPLAGLTRGANFLSIMRPEKCGPYGQDHVEKLTPYVDHIQRAIEIQKHVLDAQRQQLAGAAVLDRLDYGLMFLDATRHVVFMNQKAQKVVKDGNALTVDRYGFCHPTDARNRNALAAAIEKAVTTPLTSGQNHAAKSATGSSTILLERTGDREPLELLVSPAFPEHYAEVSCNIHAVIIIADPESRLDIPREHLKNRYGLTNTECNIAIALANGLTIADYCEQANVTLSTARTQLKRLLNKCEVRRQSDLVRVLLRSPLMMLDRDD